MRCGFGSASALVAGERLAVFLDIETTGKKADQGMITAIGLLREGKPEVRFAGSLEEERELLEWLRGELSARDRLVTWYGSGFDIPFLLARAAAHQVDLGVLLKVRMLDLCEWCRANLALSCHGLASVARFLGIETREEFSGEDMPTLWKLAAQGDARSKEIILKHCENDLLTLRAIHDKLRSSLKRWPIPWRKAKFLNFKYIQNLVARR